MSRTVFALALLPFLAGCPSTSTLSGVDRPVAVKPELARVPQALKQRCATPSDIPERDIGSEEAACGPLTAFRSASAPPGIPGW